MKSLDLMVLGLSIALIVFVLLFVVAWYGGRR